MSRSSSKYPEVLKFAKANPLPQTVEGLADALMDMSTILIACQNDSQHWDSLHLNIIYRHQANASPGSFLSNPALLANTVSTTARGKSFGNLTSGCLFSYPYYQEESLGTILLLSAFSPRTLKSMIPAHLYAQAMLFLVKSGQVSTTNVNIAHRLTPRDMEQVAAQELHISEMTHLHFNLHFSKAHIAASHTLRTDLAACAVELALTANQNGLFTASAHAKLSALVIGRATIEPPRHDISHPNDKLTSKSPRRMRI